MFHERNIFYFLLPTMIVMLNTPIIIVNLKTYEQGYGKNALKLARALEDCGRDKIALAASPLDLSMLVKNTNLPILAQHIDPIKFGSNTGFILPEGVKETGAVGTLLNHSEHRLKLADIEACVRRAREVGLITVLCTNNIETSKAGGALEPDFIAVEPPELIGGDISVSKAQPEIIKGSVVAVKKVAPNVKVLCGAGVKNGEDVRIALELGAEGVLLASGVVKAKEPKEVMKDLLSGIK